jgi:hypothetical protein
MYEWKFFKPRACTCNCHIKVWETSGQSVAKTKADHAEKVGQGSEKGDTNNEERDAEPSTITSIVKESPRSFVPKAPYPESY